NQYTEEIQRHFNVSFKEAEDIKLGRSDAQVNPEEVVSVISGVTNNMTLEVKRSLDFFLGGNPSIMLGRIMLSGGAAKTKGLRELLQDRTAMPVELVNPFNGLTLNPKNFSNEYLTDMAPHFGVAVGLATRRLGDR
ncbi:MAG: pilus assembly protein PilM, partial [Thermodesulfobacteriota bacterium]